MHSEISEDLLAPMCRVYDPTKNIPSLRSPLSAVTFIFPRHKQVDRVSFFFCRKVLSTAAPQSSCHEANVAVKVLFLTKKMCCCHAHSGVDFSLIAHLSREQVAACHFGHLKLFCCYFSALTRQFCL